MMLVVPLKMRKERRLRMKRIKRRRSKKRRNLKPKERQRRLAKKRKKLEPSYSRLDPLRSSRSLKTSMETTRMCGPTEMSVITERSTSIVKWPSRKSCHKSERTTRKTSMI